MKGLTLLLLALPLAACGPVIYQRADTTKWEFAVDQASCWDYAEQQPPAVVSGGIVAGLGDGAKQANLYKARKDIRSCMVAKGYTVERGSPFGPGTPLRGSLLPVQSSMSSATSSSENAQP